MIEDGTKFLGVDASVPTPEVRSSQVNAASSMVTIEEIAEKVEAINGGGSEYTETIVNISSDQILGGFNQLPVLPLNTPNELYDVDSISYYCDNANYTFTGTFGMYINGSTFLFHNDLLTDTGVQRTVTGKNPHALRISTVTPIYGFLRGDRDVNIGLQSGSAPTGGTGNITIKIKWKLIDVTP
jgi:hypothetical protein